MSYTIHVCCPERYRKNGLQIPIILSAEQGTAAVSTPCYSCFTTGGRVCGILRFVD